jgi:hypothetical protein
MRRFFRSFIDGSDSAATRHKPRQQGGGQCSWASPVYRRRGGESNMASPAHTFNHWPIPTLDPLPRPLHKSPADTRTPAHRLVKSMFCLEPCKAKATTPCRKFPYLVCLPQSPTSLLCVAAAVARVAARKALGRRAAARCRNENTTARTHRPRLQGRLRLSLQHKASQYRHGIRTPRSAGGSTYLTATVREQLQANCLICLLRPSPMNRHTQGPK